jgi:protein tyrosine phosphatase (PTP) superfamily phosphohydrolase (DUF442 family)
MLRTSIALISAILVAGCQQPATGSTSKAADASAARNHAPTAKVAPGLTDDKPVQLPGLHNVVRYADDVISGSVPEGDAGFASLQSMGIHTVISVDGATPQVELARRYGLTYVHLPISYDGVPTDRAVEMAQALLNCDGPFYMHCHHGKHRSAASAAAALVAAGKADTAHVTARMKVSGTSQNYPGLWESVGSMQPADRAGLRRDPKTFPQIAKVTGMVASMAELDVVFDNLKALDKSRWQVSEEHPDLVPTQETRRLLDLFNGLQQDAESIAYEADYQRMLQDTIRTATELDAAVHDGDPDTASARFAAIGKGCKACHTPYRNR